MRKLTLTLLVLLLVAALALPVSAAPKANTYSSAENLFSEQVQNWEELTSERVTGFTIRRTGPYSFQYSAETQTITYDYVRRNFEKTFTVTEDATIADFVLLSVDKNCTLVIEEGVTLTVKGLLDVSGTVENCGTIVVGTTVSEGFQTGESSGNIATIRNKGTFTNSGTLNLKNGMLENEGATVLNSGTINITNKEEYLVGISNEQRSDGSKNIAGTLNNTGTIHVKNEDGTGIRNKSGCTVQNGGKIVKSGSGTVTGTISGNAVTTES